MKDFDHAALDRYITGNWGEDSVGDTHSWCDENCEADDCLIGTEGVDSELDCPNFPEEEKQAMREAEAVPDAEWDTIDEGWG